MKILWSWAWRIDDVGEVTKTELRDLQQDASAIAAVQRVNYKLPMSLMVQWRWPGQPKWASWPAWRCPPWWSQLRFKKSEGKLGATSHEGFLHEVGAWFVNGFFFFFGKIGEIWASGKDRCTINMIKSWLAKLPPRPIHRTHVAEEQMLRDTACLVPLLRISGDNAPASPRRTAPSALHA